MTPKEKAEELIDKYRPLVKNWDCYWDIELPEADILRDCKQCAIICVEQILPCTWKLETYKKWGFICVDELTTTEYWQEVLSHLKNT